MKLLPPWFKQELPDLSVHRAEEAMNRFGVDTVCRQANCPNINDCFRNGRFTFMILGKVCTRTCKFCNVPKKVIPAVIDSQEPGRIADAVKFFKLKYAVVTSVTRDDLNDGGAGQFAEVIASICSVDKNIRIEILVPDFGGSLSSLNTVIMAKPFILGHNLETVRRLYDIIRPEADYDRSLNLLRNAKEADKGLITKSSLMLGFGELEEEVVAALKDLRKAHCDIVTLGQYLAPSVKHYPVKEYISPEQFQRYADIAKFLGFKKVLSGPKVRSSYYAENLSRELEYA